MARYVQYYDQIDITEPPEPTLPLGLSAIKQYRSAIKNLLRIQQSKNVTSLTWEQVWLLESKQLIKLIRDWHQTIKKIMKKRWKLSSYHTQW